MTEKPRAADPETAGSTPGGSGSADQVAGDGGPGVVIHDNRKIKDSGRDAPVDPAAEATADPTTTPAADGLVEDAEVVVDVVESETAPLDRPAPDGPPVVDAPTNPVSDAGTSTGSALGAELEALRSELDERTRDLQRVSAEYANYRKRVDRDRGLVAEQTTASVLAALLPVLDDLDRARDHGDLVGPFGTVAEQLTTGLGKFGLTAFGEPGETFDPTRHEAVAHLTSADVTESTCVEAVSSVASAESVDVARTFEPGRSVVSPESLSVNGSNER